MHIPNDRHTEGAGKETDSAVQPVITLWIFWQSPGSPTHMFFKLLGQNPSLCCCLSLRSFVNLSTKRFILAFRKLYNAFLHRARLVDCAPILCWNCFKKEPLCSQFEGRLYVRMGNLGQNCESILLLVKIKGQVIKITKEIDSPHNLPCQPCCILKNSCLTKLSAHFPVNLINEWTSPPGMFITIIIIKCSSPL